MTTGIYILSFAGTDKVYIGLSLDIEGRFNVHLSRFKNNRAAVKLQNAYNIYGTPTLTILHECKESDLSFLEKAYIEEFDSVCNGFNASPGGEAGNVAYGEDNSKSFSYNEQYKHALVLLASTPLTHEAIAIESDLTTKIVSNISNGSGHLWLQKELPEEYTKVVERRGTHANVYRHSASRPHNELVSPSGELFNITNIRLLDFCVQHELTQSKVSKVLNGHIIQHKGWHLPGSTIKKIRPPTTLISPDNKEYTVIYGEYTKFAKEHNLDPGTLRKLVAGKVRHHHNWKLKPDVKD